MAWHTEFTEISKWNNAKALISCHSRAGRDEDQVNKCYYDVPQTEMQSL